MTKIALAEATRIAMTSLIARKRAGTSLTGTSLVARIGSEV